jgi:hypothetical protein
MERERERERESKGRRERDRFATVAGRSARFSLRRNRCCSLKEMIRAELYHSKEDWTSKIAMNVLS